MSSSRVCVSVSRNGGLRPALLGIVASGCAMCATAQGVGSATLASSERAADDGSAATLEEVTVTAQRRAERLQDTPIAVTAFTATAIDRLGVSNVQQLAEFVPNVRFDFTAPISGASDAAGVFIRGIGQSDFALTTEAGVGTYVDGVYMSRSLGGVLDVLDIERMEVLRGPQGTLFGRNTIGGAINIVSAKPTDDFSGSSELQLGSFSRLYLRGTVNLPVSESLKVRITASSKQRDGYVRSILAPSGADSSHVPRGSAIPGSGSQIDFGNENRQAARLVALYDPHTNFTAELSADYGKVRENNAPAILRGVTGTLANGPVVFVYNTFQAPTTTIPGFPNAQYSAANFVTGNLSSTYSTGPNGTRIDALGTALTLAWHPQADLELKSISAYRHTKGFFNRDADGSPIDITHTSNYGYRHEQGSEELQFNGKSLQDRLKFAMGVYYFTETGSDPLVVEFPSSFGILYQDTADVHNSSAAGYAQGTLKLTDTLSFTAGARYTRDKKEFHSDQYLITGAASPIVFGVPPGTLVPLVPRDSRVNRTFTDTSPHASLDFKLLEDLLLYASYGTGFKSGGFNLRYVSPRSAVLPFDPEKVTAYEAGIKTEFLDRRVRLNLAGFTNNYDDIQLTVFEHLGAPVTLNAGDARIRGGELELSAAPVAGLELSYNLGYLDARYLRINASPALVSTPEQVISTHTRLQKTPRTQQDVAVDYRIRAGAYGTVQLHADWRFTADTYNDAQNSVFLFQKAWNIGNASIGYEPLSARWSLRLFVDNVTDRRYIVSGDSNYGIGFHEAEYNRPREWGVSGKVSF
jgi:iron complex outermembrane recepter protein